MLIATSAFAQVNAPIVSKGLEIVTPENISQLRQLVSLVSVKGDTKYISISPNATKMAVATQESDYDYSIMIFDMETGEEISRMQGRMDFFRDLIWSLDSQRIAVISGRTTGSGIEERSVKTYTVALGANIYFYSMGHSDTWYADYIYPSDPPGNPVEVAWGQGSDIIAVAFHDKLAIYDARADNELFSAHVANIRFVKWSSHRRATVCMGYGV